MEDSIKWSDFGLCIEFHEHWFSPGCVESRQWCRNHEHEVNMKQPCHLERGDQGTEHRIGSYLHDPQTKNHFKALNGCTERKKRELFRDIKMILQPTVCICMLLWKQGICHSLSYLWILPFLVYEHFWCDGWVERLTYGIHLARMALKGCLQTLALEAHTQ